MAKPPKRPRDPNQLAKLILDITIAEVPNDSPKGPDNRAGGRWNRRSLEEIAGLA